MKTIKRNKLFIPRRIGPDDPNNKFLLWNKDQLVKDGVQVNQYDLNGKEQGLWEYYNSDGGINRKVFYNGGVPTYKTYYRLANNLSGEDPILPKGKAASALARFASLHPTNLSQKAE